MSAGQPGLWQRPLRTGTAGSPGRDAGPRQAGFASLMQPYLRQEDEVSRQPRRGLLGMAAIAAGALAAVVCSAGASSTSGSPSGSSTSSSSSNSNSAANAAQG